ncbi:MAG: hypothetical protein L3K14_03685 [Thermoplasmata archaeon]|nr:hypothetical protein [Thermoplasmata archaeon]
MQHCPFCGSPESDRVDLEGHRVLVFRCMFSPTVDPSWSEESLRAHLTETYGGQGGKFFRNTCDRLHLFVVQGEGARELTRPRTGGGVTPPD